MIRAILLLAVLAAAVAQNDPLPWYYHGLDGPEWTVKTVDNDVEVRNYPAQMWASTDVLDTNINDAGGIGFNILFDYISGANAANTAIDMTTPVLNLVTPGAGPNCNSTFTVSFFVPYKYQESGPPAPTNPAVYIQSIGPLEVAVSEFDGYAVQKEDILKVAALEQDVVDSKDIEDDTTAGDAWFLAGYDPPFRVTGRHNEVWVKVVDMAAKK